MKTIRHFSRLLLHSTIVAMITACSGNPPANNNQRSANDNSANASQSNTLQSRPSQQPAQGKTGIIEVNSRPPGAKVLLVPDDESGAGEPQSKGLTPTTISGVAPGKYTVHLEKPGYGFAQKVIVVKEGRTVKVSAALKKQ